MGPLVPSKIISPATARGAARLIGPGVATAISAFIQQQQRLRGETNQLATTVLLASLTQVPTAVNMIIDGMTESAASGGRSQMDDIERLVKLLNETEDEVVREKLLQLLDERIDSPRGDKMVSRALGGVSVLGVGAALSASVAYIYRMNQRRNRFLPW